MENDHSTTSVDASKRKRGRDCIDSSECLQIKNELTPFTTNRYVSNQVNSNKMKFLNARKKLDFSLSFTPKSFSLINLHEHLLGYIPVKSHGAEVDCLTLLRITAVLGKDWLDWLRDKSFLFTDCKAIRFQHSLTSY